MTSTAPHTATPPESAFRSSEIKRRLRSELRKAAEESTVLYEKWEPVLDSLRVVSVVLALEDLFSFPLPPEKLVRRGGYGSVEDGVADIFERLEHLWKERHS